MARSVLGTFLQATLLGFDAFDRTARRQALVAQHAQCFDLGALTIAGTVFQHLDIAWAGHPVFAYLLFLLMHRAPQHQQLADVLDRCSVQLVCQGLENHFAAGAVVRLDAHLDESVCVQRRIGFFFNRVGQAVRAKHDDSVEVVGFGAVVFALGGGKLYLSHKRIIDATCQWTIDTMKDNTMPAAKQGAKQGAKPGAKAIVKPAVKVDARAGTKGKKLNKAWLHEHINDPYVKQAQRDGYRARAAYKLKEIDETLGLIKPGNCVVDLGSTPGAWSQYVRRKLSPTGAASGALNGRIIALDLLPMEPIENVVFIQGDFREADVLQKLEQTLATVNGPVLVDLVISDMAPNLSGIESVDAARIAHLVELAVEFAQNQMKPDGALVVKLFHGSGYDDLVKLFRATFKTVKPMKPKASRSNSSETFLVGMGFKQAH